MLKTPGSKSYRKQARRCKNGILMQNLKAGIT
jgi:hypothetical protein